MANLLDAVAALPPQIGEIAERFTSAGHELALVGGPVRDACLGVVPHDFDLATSARPDETERLLRECGANTWDMGRAFGTIGGHLGGVSVEITTYRSDDYDAASRKPQVAFGDTLEGDLTRRDFTVNAMALRLPDYTLVDPHNGLAHLLARELRTPVSAHQSFDDDPLRIMRAVRFTSQLGCEVSEEVLSAMVAMAERLSIVSAERLRGELERLLLCPKPRSGLELMVYTGVADYVLPELVALQDTVDAQHRHKDVYEHSLTVLDQAIDLETDEDGPVPGPDLVLRIAALMHDCGKPRTRRFERDGTVTFHHHEIVGAKMMRQRMRKLTFDKQTIKAVYTLISLHGRFHGYGEQSWTDSAVRRYVADAGDQLERLHRLTRADCTTGNRRKAQRLSHAYDDLEARIAEIAEREELAKIRPDLDGTQIMEILGIAPGREVGEAYRMLLQARMDEGPLGEEEATRRLKLWWQQRS
ncbi:CCA tRNA nucleotidyltransferase [Nanchangia anserum]|uniref:CCA tRNA nucleotidyltransferase n=2 Tax=Nanchangia anserum TaxID=2692125 RepID=A0A8I0GCC5_9ACTO|nr:CCA tRNA nucleotidyltransferase [Nanchangia anserum]MBD3689560.1 CCA tRNA nucleotidyltransferase [Nanchangia anserum]QOX82662.1 CCA tRNA nucleotidyltransferase [Nanchangia anserum]